MMELLRPETTMSFRLPSGEAPSDKMLWQSVIFPRITKKVRITPNFDGKKLDIQKTAWYTEMLSYIQ